MTDQLEPEAVPEPEPVNRPSYDVLMSRALQLRCPRCGQGPLFRGWFLMHQRCETCSFRFDRGPGYYLGSIYVNYGLTALLTTAMFVFGMFWLKLSRDTMMPPLVLFTVIFPILLFRHARAWWLAMDCHFDKEVLADESNVEPTGGWVE